jgi:hypothetical protein
MLKFRRDHSGSCYMERTFSLEDVMPEETHDLFEIRTTTRSMRRLKPDPVPDALIRKIS